MAETNSDLPASVVTITDKTMETSAPTEPSLPSRTPPAEVTPHLVFLSLSISETPKIVAPSPPSSEAPTSQRPSGEQGQNPEVIKSSAIVATDSVVAVVPFEEVKNVKNELQSVGDEGAIITVEGDALADTTGPSHEEPDPSPEDLGQGSHSQDSSAPAFAVVSLKIQVPEMRSSDEEDLDNVALDAFIVKRRVVSTPESETKRPTTRLQAKVAYDFALQKSKKSSKKKRRKLVKNSVPVSDEAIPVVEVDEETPDEPGSLVRRSSKKKKPVSTEKGSTSRSKMKEVVSEFSMSDEDVLVKFKEEGKVSGEKSGNLVL
ncbi:PREDICTED: polymerase I and transcript release factor-like [Nicotiana attenuata]|uniref:polymerase I and transcript release factor-like n=1 Tax=Nicotiana attenuata TaxID=49451 RepID=UPI0009056D11|nr:PREDICTED: polymerase I and transcript release factor-like [Nicotiana attenuata]